MCRVLQFFVFLYCLSLYAQREQDTTLFQKYYNLSKYEQVFIPLGKLAFADSVIAFDEGNPVAKLPYDDPQESLGEPDFKNHNTDSKPKYVSIGCGGSLTVKFIDNGFIDVPGDDLVFFEVGPAIEPFELEISTDGIEWIDLGKIDGGSSTIDIGESLSESQQKQIFQYVRITDLKYFCKGPTPGSDIDAIGAIGAVIKLSLDAKILFDTDKYELRTNALKSLDNLKRQLREIPTAELLITGHTDSDGSEDYNMLLGKNRAEAVSDYIRKDFQSIGDYTYTTKSYGKAKPVESNTTSKGKQQNRRVEIIVKPDLEFYSPPKEKRQK